MSKTIVMYYINIRMHHAAKVTIVNFVEDYVRIH